MKTKKQKKENTSNHSRLTSWVLVTISTAWREELDRFFCMCLVVCRRRQHCVDTPARISHTLCRLFIFCDRNKKPKPRDWSSSQWTVCLDIVVMIVIGILPTTGPLLRVFLFTQAFLVKFSGLGGRLGFFSNSGVAGYSLWSTLDWNTDGEMHVVNVNLVVFTLIHKNDGRILQCSGPWGPSQVCGSHRLDGFVTH